MIYAVLKKKTNGNFSLKSGYKMLKYRAMDKLTEDYSGPKYFTYDRLDIIFENMSSISTRKLRPLTENVKFIDEHKNHHVVINSRFEPYLIVNGVVKYNKHNFIHIKLLKEGGFEIVEKSENNVLTDEDVKGYVENVLPKTVDDSFIRSLTLSNDTCNHAILKRFVTRYNNDLKGMVPDIEKYQYMDLFMFDSLKSINRVYNETSKNDSYVYDQYKVFSVTSQNLVSVGDGLKDAEQWYKDHADSNDFLYMIIPNVMKYRYIQKESALNVWYKTTCKYPSILILKLTRESVNQYITKYLTTIFA